MEKGRRHLTLKLSSWRFVTNKGARRDPLVSRSEAKTTVPKERPVSHSGTCKEEERALGFAFVALEEIRLVFGEYGSTRLILRFRICDGLGSNLLLL